ncbi:tetratricopeptide repeat protein [Salinivibrio sp. ES.052]|uniref:YfgM family protein n=1 Tax=Salinivibrio sp. ES.052 TaxID=1882823 RepID=UPI00092835A1|nr:tetratricopeptide repeat protein [Salinivibrio sp. ES.052]SIN74194.1 Putative negative regulator of RcsB-dependent stress response [Salinivibrio sp. ES.052]
MDVYTTEEQQVEAIKKWWRDNGKAVVIGAVVGLGALYGWRYFQSQQLENKEQASQQYEQALSTIERGDTVALSQLEDHDGYRALAALQLAQKQVEQGELESAREQLQIAKQSVKDEALYGLVVTRLARVEAELGDYEAALNELDNITASSWTAKVQEIRGDILLRQGDSDAARDAYAASLAAADSPTVNMKLDNLSL